MKQFHIDGDKIVWGVAGAAVGAIVAYMAIDYYLYKKALNGEPITEKEEKLEEILKPYSGFQNEQADEIVKGLVLISLDPDAFDVDAIDAYDTIAYSLNRKECRNLDGDEIVWKDADVDGEATKFLEKEKHIPEGVFYILYDKVAYEVVILNDEEVIEEKKEEVIEEKPKLKVRASKTQPRRRVAKGLEENE